MELGIREGPLPRAGCSWGLSVTLREGLTRSVPSCCPAARVLLGGCELQCRGLMGECIWPPEDVFKIHPQVTLAPLLCPQTCNEPMGCAHSQTGDVTWGLEARGRP